MEVTPRHSDGIITVADLGDANKGNALKPTPRTAASDKETIVWLESASESRDRLAQVTELLNRPKDKTQDKIVRIRNCFL